MDLRWGKQLAERKKNFFAMTRFRNNETSIGMPAK